MSDSLSLPTLLSHALVAFTIEFDNEFERQTPHRTSSPSHPGAPGDPWLVSRVLWTNFLRFVPEDGISVADLRQTLPTPNKVTDLWITRLSRWWGYLAVHPHGPRRPSGSFNPASVVFPTPAGRRAIEVWQPLTEIIVDRWRTRFGAASIRTLEAALRTLVEQLDPALPDSLPIIGYGLTTPAPAPRAPAPVAKLSLPDLLSRALLAFTLDFERDADLSLALSANVLRVLANDGVRLRDLPRLTGISKEAVAMSLSFLVKRGHAGLHPETPGSRVKAVLPTPSGQQLRDAYPQQVRVLVERWEAAYGKRSLQILHEALTDLSGDALLQATTPPPTGWRAALPTPETLPHFPVLLHRGGFPDGS